MTRNKADKRKPQGIESGDLYVGTDGYTFTMPAIDYDLIRKYAENKYIVEGLNKQQRVLFKKRYTVALHDTEEQKDDEKGTAALERMCKQPDVQLWYTLQRLHRNTQVWGPAPYNPVWKTVGNEYTLIKLRDLEPLTFKNQGSTWSTVKNRILPGISLKEGTEEIEYWQTKRNGQIELLQNIEMMVDPLSGEIGGTPFILPLIPLVSMVKHAWKRQMQVLNKIGIFFIRVTDPQGDDKAFAQKVMRNASTDTGFTLRGNMEPIELTTTGSGTALDTITELGVQIRQYFSPSDIISKDGTLIGGSSNPEFDLYMAYIEGTHRWLEDECEYMLQPYLTENGFDDKYEIRVEIPDPQPDRSKMLIDLVVAGHHTQAINTANKRHILSKALAGNGVDLEEMTPQQQKEMEEEYARAPKSAALGVDQKYQKAALVVQAVKDEMDPYALMSKKEARKYLQTTLGIESGEV